MATYEVRFLGRSALHDVDGTEARMVLYRDGTYWQFFSARASGPAIAGPGPLDNLERERFWQRFVHEGARLVEEFVRERGAELDGRSEDHRIIGIALHPDVQHVASASAPTGAHLDDETIISVFDA